MRQLFLALLLLSSFSFAGEHSHDDKCDDKKKCSSEK
ncbi:MAG: Unknown protein [uncultured Sulfurovum sp.]|uniref:Uncharacterized protein n=1 Tax=uncultured Sulfurovum sp. TaxID=269237 RepID=A0A6S6SWL5_9BACT|nr:MAG: Unknown protein [uncultured Sulfurovum sp.]